MASTVPEPIRPDEARVVQLGRALFERVRADASGLYRADRWTGALFDWALAHEDAKLRLFRFVDVLPALATDREVVRHLREYFRDRPLPLAGALEAALTVARVPWAGERIVAVLLRETVRRLARRFIAGSTPESALRAAADARRAGQAFTLDVLGEACLSDTEAAAYQRRYLELVEHLGPEAQRWPEVPRLDRAAWGPLPRVNVSVKLSALDPYFDPVAPRRAFAAVGARLRPILRAARAHQAHISDRHGGLAAQEPHARHRDGAARRA